MKLKLEVNPTDGKFVFLLSPVSPKDGNRMALCGCECPGIGSIPIHYIFLLLQVIPLANPSYFLTNTFSSLFHFSDGNQVHCCENSGKCLLQRTMENPSWFS